MRNLLKAGAVVASAASILVGSALAQPTDTARAMVNICTESARSEDPRGSYAERCSCFAGFSAAAMTNREWGLLAVLLYVGELAETDVAEANRVSDEYIRQYGMLEAELDVILTKQAQIASSPVFDRCGSLDNSTAVLASAVNGQGRSMAVSFPPISEPVLASKPTDERAPLAAITAVTARGAKVLAAN